MQWLIDIIIATICPPGMIMLWHGAVVDIPSGWAYCDGTLGTPDLRDKFVRGASTTRPPGTTGGVVQHKHYFTGDGHAHELPVGTDISSGADFDKDTTVDPADGLTGYGESIPPYHSLSYIMKL